MMAAEWELLQVLVLVVAVQVTMPVQTAMPNLATMLSQVIRLSQRLVLDQKADSVLVMVLAVVAEEVWEAWEVVVVPMSMR